MKLATIFTDSMILQRDMPIRVFGTGEGTATIQFLGETVRVKAENGKWCAYLSPKPYGGPYAMEIDLDGTSVTLKDILIGDVFLACGQSNMELPLYETESGFDDAKYCENQNVRYFTVPRRFKKGVKHLDNIYEDMCDQDMSWRRCCESSALNFSAIGHYFAQYIYTETDVPIGIISCNWGGRSIESFIEKKYFYGDPVLDGIIKDFDQHNSTLDMERYEKDFEQFINDYNDYILKYRRNHRDLTRKIGVFATTIARPDLPPLPTFERGPYDGLSPSTLWESMFSEIVPYGVKAMLWYQGETNAHDMDYMEKYLTFLRCIRENFENDMDVYAVELASFMFSEEDYKTRPHDSFATKDNWAFLREQQQKATRIGRKNYLVTTQQLGDMFDVHPRRKKEVARRLALKVLKYTYGKDIKADHPVFRSAEFVDGKAYITLDHAEGLFGDTNNVSMYIAGEDKVLHKATVEIMPDSKLCVYSKAVTKPMLVRYAFNMYYFGTHLYNDIGLPLAPFRTDS